jgi:hypothetical protein
MTDMAQWSEPELERLGDATQAQNGQGTNVTEAVGGPNSAPSGPN